MGNLFDQKLFDDRNDRAKIRQQEKMEIAAMSEGKRSFYKHREMVRNNPAKDNLMLGSEARLFSFAIRPTAVTIQSFCNSGRRVGVYTKYKPLLAHYDPFDLAFIAVRRPFA